MKYFVLSELDDTHIGIVSANTSIELNEKVKLALESHFDLGVTCDPLDIQRVESTHSGTYTLEITVDDCGEFDERTIIITPSYMW